MKRYYLFEYGNVEKDLNYTRARVFDDPSSDDLYFTALSFLQEAIEKSFDYLDVSVEDVSLEYAVDDIQALDIIFEMLEKECYSDFVEISQQRYEDLM